MGCEVDDGGSGLPPLEFTDCLTDSPQFRDNLQRHEKELERTSQQIKRLIKEVKDVVSAARRLGSAQLALASSMEQFEFACIGASMTEDERAISHSLRHFAALIRTVEDERDRMLSRAHEQIVAPLEKFRKEHIGAVKEGKKKFDKKTAKFCQTQERTLALSTKKPDAILQEADAALEMASRDFCAASAEYVCVLQAVHERKKFELVETLLGFVFSWWTFHHTAHDVHADAEPLVRDLQLRIQRTRNNFEETSKHTQSLMNKMMEARQLVSTVTALAKAKEEELSQSEGDGASSLVTKSGYLFMFEKKAFGATWTKQFASFSRHDRALTLTPYNQINVKASAPPETLTVTLARAVADCERRWCWEVTDAGRAAAALLQSVSAADRAAWLAVLTCSDNPLVKTSLSEDTAEYNLDEAGFSFVRQLIAEIEARGLTEQGLYRVAGVASKVAGLLRAAAAGRLPPAAADPALYDTRTLTSALKAFLRALPDGVCTRRLHARLVRAAKLPARAERQAALAALVRQLPAPHAAMLALVVRHLRRVAALADHNKMCAANLAVCFGPTLLKPPRETVASIMDIKFYNVCVETLILHPTLFRDEPHTQAYGGASSSAGPLATRHDMSVVERVGCPPAPPGGAPAPPGGAPARYSPQHQQLLQQFARHAYAARSSSSDAESSSRGASPPLLGPAVGPAAVPAVPAVPAVGRRVRTLYACVAEAEGELSFEANQIITDVRPSAEPGWLRGHLAGRAGLVPSNYVEPLP